MARALREDWPMSPEERRRVVERLLDAINARGIPYDTVVRAAQALIAADNVNVKRETVDSGERGQDIQAVTSLMQAIAKSNPKLYNEIAQEIAKHQQAKPLPPA